MKLKTWVKRALRTFGQTFAGTIATELMVTVSGASDMSALKAALMSLGASAVAAGIAAVMNLKAE